MLDFNHGGILEETAHFEVLNIRLYKKILLVLHSVRR